MANLFAEITIRVLGEDSPELEQAVENFGRLIDYHATKSESALQIVNAGGVVEIEQD